MCVTQHYRCVRACTQHGSGKEILGGGVTHLQLRLASEASDPKLPSCVLPARVHLVLGGYDRVVRSCARVQTESNHTCRDIKLAR